MLGWVAHMCSKSFVSTHFTLNVKQRTSREMIPKITLLLVFLCGVTFAVFVNFMPNISSLLITTKDLLGLSGSGSVETPQKAKIRNPWSRENLCSQSLLGLAPAIHTHSGHDAETLELSFQTPLDANRPTAELTAEAVAAMNLAKDMNKQGKVEKALKLYQHAIALNSNHPDILNQYGEFLEGQKDYVSAEHMYCRALVLTPTHQRALANRRRTLPLVEDIDQTFFNRLDSKRQMLHKVPDSHPGLRRQSKENYFKHIHHTTALEGNTFTLSQTRLLVENRLAIGGKSIIEHNEILGMDAALAYINNTLIHRIGAITLEDIKSIHKRVLGFVDPIGAGEIRTTQVFVGDFMPPKPLEIPSLIEEFIEWLNSEEAIRLHPIEFAALAHYKLVWIHPFYDGNGRTSRLLMNLILLQAGYPPIIIRVEDKPEYYRHLETANNGDLRPFIRFIGRCAERTVDEFLLAVIENPAVYFPELAPNVYPKDDGRTIIIDEDHSQTSEHIKTTDSPSENGRQ